MLKKRTMFLVEKQVQGALGWRLAAHWFIFLGLSVSVTCALQMLGSFQPGSLWSHFQNAILGQLGSIVVLLALLPWFIHDSLKLSNRFAGPMVRLRRAIVDLTTDEQAPPVSFRSDDFWQEIAVDFNHLRSRVLAERELLAKHSSRGLTAQSNSGVKNNDESTLPITAPVWLPTIGPAAVPAASSVNGSK